MHLHGHWMWVMQRAPTNAGNFNPATAKFDEVNTFLAQSMSNSFMYVTCLVRWADDFSPQLPIEAASDRILLWLVADATAARHV